MNADALRALIERGDATEIRVRLTQLSERERRALAPEAARAWKAAETEVAQTAFLMTCSLSELSAHAKKHWFGPAVADLWLEARPSWLEQAAEVLLEARPLYWPLARRLVREGVSAVPTSENYVLGMYHRSFQPFPYGRPLADRLLDDPQLLESLIWRIFEVEGGGELSLAAHDKFSRPDTAWDRALLSLMERGHLSRERLLDASLAALERDFAAFRAGWFSRFHEELAPTPDERFARRATYLRLLSSPIAPTVSFALEAVRAIDAQAPLAAEEALAYLGPVLLARQKGTAKAALKLLAAMARREPQSRAAIARAALDALAHEAADVQSAALDLIQEYGDDALASELADRAAFLAPSVAKRLGGRVSGAPPTPVRVDFVSEVAALSRLDPARALTPLATIDEVIARLAHVIEDASDPCELELALDGVARLCGDRPLDFERRIGPLRKRARDLRKRGRLELTAADSLCGVALAWAGDPPGMPTNTYDVVAYAFFVARASRVGSSAGSGTARPLLSTPTHRGGWIDPRVLVERARSLATAAPLDLLDASVALLRLAPEERSAALSAASAIEGELGQALRYALGGAEPIGPTAALWIAAARARAPREDDAAVEARHPELGPDAGRAASWSWAVSVSRSDRYTWYALEIEPSPRAPAQVRLDLPSVRVHDFAGEPFLRWASTVWPGGSESFLAQGVKQIANNLDWQAARWSNAVYLELLRDPFTTLGANAILLLSLGLAAKEPGESGLSIDAAISAFAEHRLDGAVLGESMAALMPTGLVKAARWAKTLAIVASASPGHAAHVTTAIQRSLRGDPEAGPRDQGALLAVLRELLLATDAKITDPDAWTYLAASRHRNKLRDVAP